MRRHHGVWALLLATACGGTRGASTAALPAGAEAISLLGDTLRQPDLPDATRRAFEARLDSARGAAEARPDDMDALIWLGRRTAYLGRYREAIAIYSRGIDRFGMRAELLRHRGHRWLSVREFHHAVLDLSRAAELVWNRSDEIEQDGLPNASGIPTSTLQTNIFYHLGLAHYLLGDLAASRMAWEACLARSRNPDMEVATRYWLYLTLLREGRTADAAAALAPVTRDLAIIENTSYHRLLLLFKGELREDALIGASGLDGATVAFGLGAWRAAQGDLAAAERWFRRALASGQWAAFGYIAAEEALARERRRIRQTRRPA